MNKYIKKPVEVEAIQWDGTKEMAMELLKIPGLNGFVAPDQDSFRFRINTPEGRMTVSPGDFIVKGVKGDFYPCKPDIFGKTYEPVLQEEEAPAPVKTKGKRKQEEKSSEEVSESEK